MPLRQHHHSPVPELALRILCERNDRLIVERDEEVEERPETKVYSKLIPKLTLECASDLDVKAAECGLKPKEPQRAAGLYACKLRVEREPTMPIEDISAALRLSPEVVRKSLVPRLVEKGVLERSERETPLGNPYYDLTPEARKALALEKPPREMSCEEAKALQDLVRKGLKPASP